MENKTINNITDAEILRSCIGLKDDGDYKCSSISEIILFNGKNKEDFGNEDMYEEISQRTLRKAEYMFYPCGDFVQMSMKFKSALDPELKMIWKQLNDYGELTKDNVISEKGMPIFSMNIMPDEYIGKYMLTLNGPGFWFLQPEIFGTQSLNILKVVFPLNNVNVVHLSDVDLDTIKAEAEVKRFIKTEYKEK